MSNDILRAIVTIQSWGENKVILDLLKPDSNIVSVFHILGRFSYLLYTKFENKQQLHEWINKIKNLKLPSEIPAVVSIQTQKIIDVYKQEEKLSKKEYLDIKEKYHFFVQINNPHHDDELLNLLKESPIVYSLFHLQGGSSFTVEIIVRDYNEYRELLHKIKLIETISHIETQEVISIIKYQNNIIDVS